MNIVHLGIDNAWLQTEENFSLIRYIKETIECNLCIFNWLNHYVQFNFDSYKYNIESSNNCNKNIIANINLRKQLFIFYSLVSNTLSKYSPMNLKEKINKLKA